MRKIFYTLLVLVLCIGTLAACGNTKDEAVSPTPVSTPAPTVSTNSPSPTPASTPTQVPLSTQTPTPAQPRDENATPILDQYYLNDKLMVEMLINDDVEIGDIDNGLYIGTESEKAVMIIMFRPGIQNLGASGEIARAAVSQSFSNVIMDDLQDGSLFGARAKFCTFESYPEGDVPIAGLTAAAIVNQSFYNMMVVYEADAPLYDMQLINAIFGTINILQPTVVDQGTQSASYQSQYENQISSNQVTTSPASSSTPVAQWNYLPYEYYSWWSDPGDYYPDWCYEPDWDYYGDYDYYWDWGWDDYGDWWFYEEYGDYYDYEYYQYYDDYWDDYDPWSDPGDYGYDDYWDDYWDDYDPWSDPGDYDDYWDDYDPWSDPGDYGYYDDDWDDYDPWSNPGDYGYDDYDPWSDPGDYGYDDDWDW